jgi:hypothetical protein
MAVIESQIDQFAPAPAQTTFGVVMEMFDIISA